ncbi:MAG: glycoside hydrolase [Thermoanaerobaculia bacterium]|nr:glycoside hydrolase [Thermoanaerobaculia bacterium]
MLKKNYSKNGKSCRVTFKLSPQPDAHSVAVLGEWNDWNPAAHPLTERKDGSFSTTVSLDAGQSYRFRYLVDDKSWANDEAADELVPNRFGTRDSVLNL